MFRYWEVLSATRLDKKQWNDLLECCGCKNPARLVTARATSLSCSKADCSRDDCGITCRTRHLTTVESLSISCLFERNELEPGCGLLCRFARGRENINRGLHRSRRQQRLRRDVKLMRISDRPRGQGT